MILMAARAPLLLGLAVVLYLLAAWGVAPGFYDGFAPGQPYRWVSPPPVAASGNQPPQGAQHVLEAGRGGTVATGDGQAQLVFDAGSFQSGQPVTVSVQPAATFPVPRGFQAATNVYLVTASAPLTGAYTVSLTFSTVVPAPDTVYVAPQAGGGWARTGTPSTGQPFAIGARTSRLGYLVAGLADTGGRGSGGGGPGALPVIAVAAVAVALLAAVPLVLGRRRRPGRRGPGRRPGPPPGPSPEGEAPRAGGARRRRKKRLR
jgi:hypothetical protein